MLDRDGRVSSWNAGTGRITGFQTSEIIGRPFGCCYRPEDREVGRPNLDLKTAAAEGRFEEDGWRVRHDGSRFWAHVVITALRDKNGDLSGFSQVIRDVTECRRAQESLRKSEETHRHLVEQCPEAIFVLRNGRIIFVNTAAYELLGADKPTRLIGRQAGDFIPAADREVFDHRLRSLEETGTTESSPGASFHGPFPSFTEGTLVRLDDSHVAVEIAARRINFQEEPAIQLVAHDLTGQKEMKKGGSNGSSAGSDPESLAQFSENFHRSHATSEPCGNGVKATASAILREEEEELKKLKEELKSHEQLLSEARAALQIREEFIAQSEATLLQKMQVLLERESEIEQKEDELQRMTARVGLLNGEILEPAALS
jgi:PAS domain S-box-containing protein